MVLNVNTSKEAILFLEALQKQVKIVDIIADYFPGKVNIRFEGAKENLKEAIEMAKRIHQIVNGMLYPDRADFYNYDIEFLSKTTGKTFPIKPLLQILELKGYETRREKDVIFSKIDYNDLLTLINQMDATMSEIPYEIATSSLRDVIIVIALAENSTIEQAISLAKNAKVVEEDDLNRLNLVVEPTQAIEKCLKLTQNNRKK